MRDDSLSYQVRYALETSELAELVAMLESAYAEELGVARQQTDSLVVMRIEHDDPLADLARSTEQQVFERDLGANHTPQLMADEYGPYEEGSVFYLAYDARIQRIMGSSRAMFGTAATPPKVFDLVERDATCQADVLQRHGCPADMSLIRSLHDMRIDDGIVDFATLAVAPDARSLARANGSIRPSILLYAAMVRESYFMRGDTFGSGEVTVQLLKFLRSLVGLPTVAIAGLAPFAAFEGDEVLSAPFIFRWSDWTELQGDETVKGTKLGRTICRLAAGSQPADAILFG